MKCLLKISFTFLLIILLSQSLRAQLDCRNGYYLPTSGTIRVLVIFAEVNYDIDSDPFPSTGYAGWPAGQLPVWKDELFDSYVTTNPQGVFTKFFKEASFGAFNVIGDYLINPEHPDQPVTINKSSGYPPSAILAAANSYSAFTTAHGLGQNDFDN